MIPQEYVKARSVLLDALDGLGPHRDAVVLVGAQAVYLHAGDTDFGTAPTTTDADLALVPDRLADEPSIVDAMRAAGFVPGSQPGIWLGRGQIAVDLMAPEAPAARVVDGPRTSSPRTTTRRLPAGRSGWSRRWWITIFT